MQSHCSPPGPDPELTAWLDYHPSYSLVKPAPASPPNLATMMGREEARKALEPDHATDDIDGGVYNPRHGEVKEVKWDGVGLKVEWGGGGSRSGMGRWMGGQCLRHMPGLDTAG